MLPSAILLRPSPSRCTLLWLQVNLAARLESMCKQYGVEILISGRMRELAGEAFIARRVDRVVAYGRRGATDIYELVATQGTALLEQVCPEGVLLGTKLICPSSVCMAPYLAS